MRMSGSTSSGVMARRAAHWVHAVTLPLTSSRSSRSGRGAACGSSNSAARPGRANPVDAPVSQKLTSTPDAAAVEATVNAWEQRSGASAPAVALTTSKRAMSASIRWAGHGYRDRVREPAGRRVGRAGGRVRLSGDSDFEGALVSGEAESAENPLGPPPWLNAPPVDAYPYEETHDLRQGADLHPALLGLLPFVGLWRGRGQGGFPAEEDYDFAQEVRISHDGRPFLRFESRAWLLDAESKPAGEWELESGFWRPVLADGRATDEM